MNEIGSTGIHGAFVIRILSVQNATWQGTVTCVNKQEDRPFRSLLELIKIIESTLSEAKDRPSAREEA
ncbi:MAG: hypothetical protein LBS24_07665 [Clostridiales Family XIII bacterium]|jgi:hypothetical protein|nr:hypothetical protein [Clostridiales Family XIII bacterium]